MIADYVKRMFRGKPLGRVAFNMRPVQGPWGGASVFTRQLMQVLARCGFDIRFDLKKPADILFVIDPRIEEPLRTFGTDDIVAYKKQHPNVKVLHRVNECDQRKGTDFMDQRLEEINAVSDLTVFISEWLKDYFTARWFDASRPHTVIYNGSDPAFFHPIGNQPYDGNGPLRVVTHHWSDNPMKGFPAYKQLDDLIADGKIDGFELWIIGRWPADITWRAAKTFPPTHDQALADLLRQCHLYITASLWEPCGAHHVEGAQCGLPLLYHADGGGIVEAGRRYGMAFRDDLPTVIEEARRTYDLLRQRVLTNAPNGELMCLQYVRAIYQMLSQ
jgi:glycosyltransferase involved in cell wall biosynthesis